MPENPESGKAKGGGGGFSDDEAARIAEPIARITAAGLPLAPGLRAAAQELPRGQARSTLAGIAGVLERGETLEAAFDAQGTRFPEHLRGLLRIGARTGDPSRALSKFIGFINVGEEIRRQLAISLVYPIIAVSLAVGIFVFVCVTVVSSFETIFRDFGVPLPILTTLLIGVARVLERSWRPLLEVLIGAGLLWVFLRFALGKSTRRGLASSLPVIGSVWRNTSLAEFCHLLSLMIESGIPLSDSIRLTGSGVGDARFKRAGQALADDVSGGLSLSQAVLRQGMIPRGLSRLLRWAEGHQSLPEALRMAGQMFEARARAQAKFAGTILTVVAVLALMFGVTAVVLGVMLPMVMLISRLSG